MPLKAKKFAIKAGLILLSVTQFIGFIFLKLLGWISLPFLALWRFGLRGVVFSIYRQILKLKLSKRFVVPAQKLFSTIFGHRYVVHVMIAFIVIFVSGKNIYAREVDLGMTSQESLIFQMIDDAEGIAFVETRELTDSFLNKTFELPEGATSTPISGVLGGDAGLLAYDSGVLKAVPPSDDETIAPAEVIGIETDEEIDHSQTEFVEELRVYTVQPGDTIGGIAQRHGISINTVLWANNMTARSIIRPGQELTILPTTGILHTVTSGQTLGYIANKYDSDIDSILEFNDIAGAHLLQIGDDLVIPGGKQVTAPRPTTTTRLATVKSVFTPEVAPAGVSGEIGKLVWPTDQSLINQYYKWNHPGLDINGRLTNNIYAVDDGTVIYSGWNSGGYGYMILIDHGNGMKSRYAHESKLFVEAGDQVIKGQTIGKIGSTGRSTGPHIHFELYVNGSRVNPLNYYR